MRPQILANHYCLDHLVAMAVIYDGYCREFNRVSRHIWRSHVERFSAVLLDVWREAGRHIEIRESASNIARLLAEHLPLAHLLVRRLDATHHALETIAVGQVENGPSPPLGKTLLTSTRVKRLIAWGREGTVLHAAAGAKSGDLATIVPAEG